MYIHALYLRTLGKRLSKECKFRLLLRQYEGYELLFSAKLLPLFLMKEQCKRLRLLATLLFVVVLKSMADDDAVDESLASFKMVQLRDNVLVIHADQSKVREDHYRIARLLLNHNQETIFMFTQPTDLEVDRLPDYARSSEQDKSLFKSFTMKQL